LAYSVAKIAKHNGISTKIIHVGNLNAGHDQLILAGWDISPIKKIQKINFKKYRFLIIEEAQRLNNKQFEEILQNAKENRSVCLFSYDRQQTLALHEQKTDIGAILESEKGALNYKLSDKIRSNKEVSDFIKMLFDHKKNYSMTRGENIEIRYFTNPKEAKPYIETIDGEVWEVIKFTPSRFNNEFHELYSPRGAKVSHAIIGQEFDDVALIIDKNFKYDDDGALKYFSKTYYHAEKMLFQNITRAKKRLLIIIIGNEKLLDRCISILSRNSA